MKISLTAVAVLTLAQVIPSAAIAQSPDDALLVGKKTILVPSPAGQFRLDGKSKKEDQLFGLKMPEGGELHWLSVYGSREALAAVLADRAPALDKDCARAAVPAGTEDLDVTAEMFLRTKEGMREGLKANLSTMGADVSADLMAHFKKKLGKNPEIQTNLVSLPFSHEQPQSFIFTLLSKTNVELGGAKIDALTVNASCLLLVKRRLLCLGIVRPCKVTADIEMAQSDVAAWAARVLAMNQ